MTVSKPVELKNTELFKPIKVADCTPSDLQLEYYDDSSKYPGSLLITEATLVSEQRGFMEGFPCIWNERHAKSWKMVTEKVHSNCSFISCHFMYFGRAGDQTLLKEHGMDLVAPSVLYESEEARKNGESARNPIRALTEEEIRDGIYNTYTNAAENAIKAGFDYIELHAAHGYLLDTNLTTSQILEPINNVGAERLAIRISPWSRFQGMKAEEDEIRPIATFGYLLQELQKRANAGKQVVYVSIIEPRVSGIVDVMKKTKLEITHSCHRSGKDISDHRTLVGFSRYYTSNPDLANRLAEDYPLTPYDSTFYTFDNCGYNTFAPYGQKSVFNKDKLKFLLKQLLNNLNIGNSSIFRV